MSTDRPERLTVADLQSVLTAGAEWLARNRDAINAINVYPVPDGDTGTNMLLTLRAALEAGEQDGPARAGAYLRAVARGALLGARGNSGVILSQMLRGFGAALETDDAVDVGGLCRALEGAAQAAYEAVSEPVEGTMLTVMSEAAHAASEAGEQDGASIASVLFAAREAARESADRTPELLPLLREAGVIDAGGLGIAVLLAGFRMGYLGETLPEAALIRIGSVELSAVEHTGHGYCTEYLLEPDGATLDREELLASLEAAGGDSILVAGDAEALHVHVHVVDPGPALTAGVNAGRLRNIKIDNMQVQHEAWAAAREQVSMPRVSVPEIGLVAVAPGPGLAAAFRELGAVPLSVEGNKPSAGAFLEAARRAGTRHVFLLPNDKDAVMAAEQAAAETPDFISVIPARSLAAGVSAAVAYQPEGDPVAIGRAMLAAIEGVRCIEVTRAARGVDIGGVAVTAGQPIALLDGVLVAKGDTVEEALLAGLRQAVGEASELITVYVGRDGTPGAEERARGLIEAVYPQLNVEVVAGGQPHYPYVVGVE